MMPKNKNRGWKIQTPVIDSAVNTKKMALPDVS
jgi:hypothetical protein